MAMSYLLQLLHARIVDHNLAGSTLPPQSRFLQEERETCVHGGALYPGGKKLAVKQEMFRSLCDIYFFLSWCSQLFRILGGEGLKLFQLRIGLCEKDRATVHQLEN